LSVLLSGVTVLYILVPPEFSFEALTTVDLFGFVLFTAVGSLVSYLLRSWRDSTRRLRDSEERLHFAIEAARFAEWNFDPGTGCFHVSRRFSEIFGLTAVQRTDWDLGRVLQFVAEDRRAEFREGLRAAAVNGTEWEFQAPIRRADGAEAWIWLKGAGAPAGDRTLFTGLLADITERRRAEEAVRESERIYRAIGETIDYGVWICAPDGRNTYVSESFLRMVGMTQEQCSEFGWGDVLHPDERGRTIERWKECVAREGLWDVEHRFLGVDGQYRHVLARGAPVRDEAGRILCWAGINLDITGLREAEQERAALYESLKAQAAELERSNRELDEFAFVASHDLQEPLRNINVYSELLLRKANPANAAELRPYTGFIKSAVERMDRLIRDLLAYSRAMHAEPVDAPPVSAGTALAQAIGALRTVLDETATEISAGPLPAVRADELQLAQVFQNVISNSIKYRRAGVPPRIAISAECSNADAIISIRDNGIGFNPEYSERVFGLFKRLHRDEYPGTGLGLAICKRIVERFGGAIWAESEPGHGTAIHIRLPAAALASR
jgi:PAS domain S-box-containing protein